MRKLSQKVVEALERGENTVLVTVLESHGSAPRGIGALIINAMQNFQIALLWSAALLAVVVSLTLFAVLGVLQRVAARAFQ